MNYNGTEYYYVTNMQGDVIKLIDVNGVVKAEYKYDAWGNVIYKTGSLADINPYRYRGYRYDEELGLYYLQSRYYNPETHRFISADGLLGEQGDPLGHNMYAYCQNNPVMFTDSTGYAPEWHHWLRSGLAVAVGIALVSTGVFTPLGGALIGMGVNSMISGYISESSGGNFDSGYYGGAITGFICGGAAGVGGAMISAAGEAGTLSGLIGGVLFSSGGAGLGGLLGTLYTDVSNTGKTNISNALLNAGIYATMNVFTGVGSAITSQLMYTGQRTVVGGFTFAAEGIIDAATVIVNEICERLN